MGGSKTKQSSTSNAGVRVLDSMLLGPVAKLESWLRKFGYTLRATSDCTKLVGTGEAPISFTHKVILNREHKPLGKLIRIEERDFLMGCTERELSEAGVWQIPEPVHPMTQHEYWDLLTRIREVEDEHSRSHLTPQALLAKRISALEEDVDCVKRSIADLRLR